MTMAAAGVNSSHGACGDGADVLRLLQQHAPGDDRRLQADAEEGQRGLGEDHRGDRQGQASR